MEQNNQSLVIQWSDMRTYDNSSEEDFQVILTPNQILKQAMEILKFNIKHLIILLMVIIQKVERQLMVVMLLLV